MQIILCSLPAAIWNSLGKGKWRVPHIYLGSYCSRMCCYPVHDHIYWLYGKCPDTTTHNSATCSEFPVTTNGTLCVFAIQSEFCPGHAMHRTIGNISDRINVALKGIWYLLSILWLSSFLIYSIEFWISSRASKCWCYYLPIFIFDRNHHWFYCPF